MKQKALLLLLITFVHWNLFSQQTNPLRIEIEDNKIDEVYSLPISNQNLLIFEHLRKRASKGDQWNMSVYDAHLQKLGNKTLFLPREFMLYDHKLYNDSIIWLCFAEKGGRNSSTMLYRLNIKTMAMAHAYIRGSRRSNLKGIEIVDNQLFLIGTDMREVQEQVNLIKFPFGVHIIIPKIPDNATVLASMSVTEKKKVIVLLDDRKNETPGLYYYEYNADNVNGLKNYMPETKELNLIDGTLITSSDSAILFMGTFNTDKRRQQSKDLIVTEGVYIGKIVNGQFDFFKTNSFEDFKNVYSTLDYNEQIKLKQRQSKGKEVNIEFKLLVHKRALKQGDLYVMAAETYYPEYHYESNFDTRGYLYQMEVFDGYRTTNCIVAGFDANGELVWDNYMRVNEIREYGLQENIIVFAEPDTSIVMAYYNKGEIKSKVVKGNEVVFKKSEDRLETVLNETIISEDIGHLQAWYDSYFILSGYQVIIGKNSKKRKVFFFNMVSFE